MDGLVGNGTVDYELKNSYLTVTDHLFDDDALVIENQNVHEVSLCDMEGNPYQPLRWMLHCLESGHRQEQMYRLYV